MAILAEETLCKAETSTTLYSFWMSADAYAGALIHQKHQTMPFVARGHAFDIATERNPMNPYLMKRLIAMHADRMHPISQMGEKQMMTYLAEAKEKISPLAMGSMGKPVAEIAPTPLHQTGVLHLISCAKVIPIKQVPLIVEALNQWDGCPLHWTHIGGGDGAEALEQLAMEKLDRKENIIYELLGDCTHEDIQLRYEKHAYDVFLNVSKNEGVPVSIMEAMRFGIPAIAPDVGGISELVTADVGILYPSAEGAQGVVKAIRTIADMEESKSNQMRTNAKKRWETHFQSDRLLSRLFECEKGSS